MFLGRRLLTCEHVTRLDNRSWIDGNVAFVNVPDDAFFIDQEGCAISKALLLVKDTIVLDDGALEIAEKRKHDSNLFGEFAVGGNTVYAHAENLSFV